MGAIAKLATLSRTDTCTPSPS